MRFFPFYESKVNPKKYDDIYDCERLYQEKLSEYMKVNSDIIALTNKLIILESDVLELEQKLIKKRQTMLEYSGGSSGTLNITTCASELDGDDVADGDGVGDT